MATMIVIVMRKMVKNGWLVLCLLLGLIIAVALVSSIPVYSSGVLQKMLIKEMENYQQNSGSYPGACQFSLFFRSETNQKDRYALLTELDRYVKTDVSKLLNIPFFTLVEDMETDLYSLYPEDPVKVDPTPSRLAKLKALSDFESHIELSDGRMPSREKADGVYEALVTEGALSKLKMVLENTFIMKVPVDGGELHIKIKPVGVFFPKETDDLYWTRTSSLYDERFYIHNDLFKSDFASKGAMLVKSYEWYYALDYHKVMVHDINRLLKNYDFISRHTKSVYTGIKFGIPIIDILKKYLAQQQQIIILLLSLNVPVLLMLCFYLLMVSSLIINADRNEIALYKSRGAPRWHIVLQYLAQGIILSAIALLFGPYLGLLLTRMLGAPQGFMEFAGRKALPLALNDAAYHYALLGICVFIIMLLATAYKASAITIVIHKQQLARNTGTAWWKRFYIDIILLFIAIYGIYSFRQHKQVLDITGIDATELKISPLLFLASTFFILGIGLMFIRVYPWVLNGIYMVGRRWWSPPLYETLIRVGRSSQQYQFIMIFLIMTLATGLFSADAARTLSNNTEDRIRYYIGSDINLMPVWQSEFVNPEPEVAGHAFGQAQQPGMEKSGESLQYGQVQYIEPPFISFEQLPEVACAAKVFKRRNVNAETWDSTVDNVQLMAIDPYDFGLVAWSRGDLLKPYHINDYLNLLAQEPSAVLVSQSFSDAYKVKAGDYIRIGWPGINSANFIVYGVIRYWPSWNPVREIITGDSQPANAVTNPILIVANLDYVQDQLALEPYEIWLKLRPDASSSALYKNIEKRGLLMEELKDAGQEVKKIKNSPSYLGINGATTLAFIMSLAITFLGFMIFWVLAIKNHVFEFGILRAMGISMLQLVGMMIWEQLLTSVMAVMAGIFTGGLTSRLFVSFFEVAYSSDVKVPPFRVISEYNDRLKLYYVLVIMLIIGFMILSSILMKIKINQAIKLGED